MLKLDMTKKKKDNLPLTRKQWAFVKELVSQDGLITLRQAAINAGYAPRSAHQRAYELTNPKIYPHVVAEIKRYRAELDAQYGVTRERHLEQLQRIRELAIENKNFSAAVMAEYRRGQAHGEIYINKSEVRHGSIDSMTKEEVLKALKDLADERKTIEFITAERTEENTEEGDSEE